MDDLRHAGTTQLCAKRQSLPTPGLLRLREGNFGDLVAFLASVAYDTLTLIALQNVISSALIESCQRGSFHPAAIV